MPLKEPNNSLVIDSKKYILTKISNKEFKRMTIRKLNEIWNNKETQLGGDSWHEWETKKKSQIKKRNQVEMLEMKNTIHQISETTESLNRLPQVKETSSELEHKTY